MITPIRIPEDRVFVTRLQTDDLALKWFPGTAVLGVYSAIIPQERIYVLNPAHPEFKHIEFLDSEPFRFDPRLKQIA